MRGCSSHTGASASGSRSAISRDPVFLQEARCARRRARSRLCSLIRISPAAIAADEVHAGLALLVQFHGVATIRDMTLLIAMPGLAEAGIGTSAREGRGLRHCAGAVGIAGARARRLPMPPDWRAGVHVALAGRQSGVPRPSRRHAVAARAAGAQLAGGARVLRRRRCTWWPASAACTCRPVACLQLDAAEAAQPGCDAFNREFGGPRACSLHAVGSGWLLAAPFAEGAPRSGAGSC